MLFRKSESLKAEKTPTQGVWPRVLILDPSPLGSFSATGQLLETIFRGWPRDNIRQISSVKDELLFHEFTGSSTTGRYMSFPKALLAVEDFSPELVFFRPDSRAKSLLAILDLLALTKVPVVLVVLDSWVNRLRLSDSDSAYMWDSALDDWAQRSVARFAVSKEMAEELENHTSKQFDVLSNSVDLWAFPEISHEEPSEKTRFLYSGMLGSDKAGSTAFLLASIFDRQVKKENELVIQSSGNPSEVRYVSALSKFLNVSTRQSPPEQLLYQQSLLDADVNVVLFEFSSPTTEYLKYSFANRIPELMAAGRPILAIGPSSILNIQYLAESGAAIVVDKPEIDEIEKAVKRLSYDQNFRETLSQAARKASLQFDSRKLRPNFHEKIRILSAAGKEVHNLKDLYPTDPRDKSSSKEIKKPDVAIERIENSRENRFSESPISEEDLNPSISDLEAITSLKGAHLGETCVILGNGPSLNQTDLTLLDNQVIFGSNAIFLLFDEVKWRPRYYSAVDTRFVPDQCEEVNEMLRSNPEITGFFPTTLRIHDGSNRELRTRELIEELPNRILFRQIKRNPVNEDFASASIDARRGLVTPSTVTVTLLQLAAHMGFKKIVLVGCDTTYSIPKSVVETGPEVRGYSGEKMLLTSTEDDDPNHFRPDYFGKGREWHHPKTDYMIAHYQAASSVFRAAEIEIVNSTVGGALEVFPRVPLAEALTD
tara:strand:+ start:825 stop:2960 length:2136 start_codon:yes stop_codon:yes gene_type:complete